MEFELTEMEMVETTGIRPAFFAMLRKLTLLKPLPYRANRRRGKNVYLYPRASRRIVIAWYGELWRLFQESPHLLMVRVTEYMRNNLPVDPSGYVSRNKELLRYLKHGKL